MNKFRIHGYWHVYTVNHWRSIVREMHADLDAGLLHESTRLTVVATGPEANKVLGELSHNKLRVVSYSENRFEFPTLERLWRDSFECESAAFFYIHSKGVSYPDDRHARWRYLLRQEIIRNFRVHIENLERGLDISGFNYMAGGFGPYFSGNFWFANSAYVQALPNPASLDQSNRYLAESWIGSAQHKYYSSPFIEPNP